MPKRLTIGELYDRISVLADDMADAAVSVDEAAEDLYPSLLRAHKAIGKLLDRIAVHPDLPDEPPASDACLDLGRVALGAQALETTLLYGRSFEVAAENVLIAAYPEVFATPEVMAVMSEAELRTLLGIGLGLGHA